MTTVRQQLIVLVLSTLLLAPGVPGTAGGCYYDETHW